MQQAINDFVQQWQELYDEYMEVNFPANNNPPIKVSYGRKYAKLTREGSVIAFIDMTTGDIYMAASYNSPAKHVRGNVNSKQNGLEALNITKYHPHVRRLA